MSPRIKEHYHTKVTPIGPLSRMRVTRSGLGPRFTPAHSAFGFPSYVAPLPAGSIQRVCHDTPDFIQVPGYPSAIRVLTLTHSRRNVVQRSSWLISLTHDLPSS